VHSVSLRQLNPETGRSSFSAALPIVCKMACAEILIIERQQVDRQRIHAVMESRCAVCWSKSFAYLRNPIVDLLPPSIIIPGRTILSLWHGS
jgi:hypothetical protein